MNEETYYLSLSYNYYNYSTLITNSLTSLISETVSSIIASLAKSVLEAKGIAFLGLRGKLLIEVSIIMILLNKRVAQRKFQYFTP